LKQYFIYRTPCGFLLYCGWFAKAERQLLAPLRSFVYLAANARLCPNGRSIRDRLASPDAASEALKFVSGRDLESVSLHEIQVLPLEEAKQDVGGGGFALQESTLPCRFSEKLTPPVCVKVPEYDNPAAILATGHTFPCWRSSDVASCRLFSAARQYALSWGLETPRCDRCWSIQHQTL